MDCAKVGNLILQLRTEKGLTQRQIAEKLNISNKTVSKWECGLGCPDVTLWEDLSAILGADILRLLRGELNPNRFDVGKMDRIRFYVCPVCGNILTSTGKANISCCGRRLCPQTPVTSSKDHKVSVEEIDTEYYVTIDHTMTKDHYIAFVAVVHDDRVYLNRLYPEQSPACHLPMTRGRGDLYLYCTRDGLRKYPFNMH